MPDPASELRIAKRFAEWLSHTRAHKYSVSPGDNPPDFIMEPQGWLEVSDIYLRNEQAKFLNVASERRYECSGPVDETARQVIAKLDEKLGKQSYQRVHAQRGKGTLLLTCQDCCFDAVNLAQVHQAVGSFSPTSDKGFFEEAFFEYKLPNQERTYEVIYPKKT